MRCRLKRRSLEIERILPNDSSSSSTTTASPEHSRLTMRHGMHNKSLSRPTAARILMLRNLVSSLLQYESITTTLTKAKETQKQAERVIGWGKKGGKDNWDRANSYLLVRRSLFSSWSFAARRAHTLPLLL